MTRSSDTSAWLRTPVETQTKKHTHAQKEIAEFNRCTERVEQLKICSEREGSLTLTHSGKTQNIKPARVSNSSPGRIRQKGIKQRWSYSLPV